MTGNDDRAAAQDRRVQAILHDYLLAADRGGAPDRQEIRRPFPSYFDHPGTARARRPDTLEGFKNARRLLSLRAGEFLFPGLQPRPHCV